MLEPLFWVLVAAVLWHSSSDKYSFSELIKGVAVFEEFRSSIYEVFTKSIGFGALLV